MTNHLIAKWSQHRLPLQLPFHTWADQIIEILETARPHIRGSTYMTVVTTWTRATIIIIVIRKLSKKFIPCLVDVRSIGAYKIINTGFTWPVWPLWSLQLLSSLFCWLQGSYQLKQTMPPETCLQWYIWLRHLKSHEAILYMYPLLPGCKPDKKPRWRQVQKKADL